MESTWWTKPEQLDKEQQAVISLPVTGNHLVLGPPGSGKTNLLLLRGAYLQASGKNEFRVLTFGRVLKEFLRSGTDSAQVAPHKIRTYHGWALDVLANCGIEIPEKNFKKDREEISRALTGLSDEEVFDYRLDAILLDECQDYTVQEINALARFADNLFAAGDNRQRIYQHSGAIERLKLLCPSVKTLTWHYRNGKKISRVADGIAGTLDKPDGLEALSQYPESEIPSQVKHFDAEPLQNQVARAVPTIRDQLRVYPGALIGVLCPKRTDVKAVYDLLAAAGLANDVELQLQETGYHAIQGNRRIHLGTIHGAKGLEFRALHLMATEGISSFPRGQRRLAYTAVTRAKTSLHVYRAGPLIGSLQNGLAAIDPPPPATVDLNNLFKGS